MMMKHRMPLLFLVFGLFAAAARADDADKFAFFEARIRPVLVDSCLQCHGEKKASGKLRLDSKAGMLKGGFSGPAIVPGKSKDSLLVKAIKHLDPELKMPTKGPKLTDVVIADFEKWIDMGAPDPRDGKGPSPGASEGAGIDWRKARDFWSFQQPKMPPLPEVKNALWCKTPIDRFILAKLEAEKLTPVRPADKRDLIRRATFDLIGLPPTPEEVDAFLKDEAPEAFARVIDRLLASPHYGERWGRYWLDVARYAEDQAHTFAVVPNTNAWRYRDWVIAAFNEDMPYDRFVKLQIAADLIEKDDAGRMKNLPALGFFGLGAQYYKNTDAAKAAADELDDRVDTLTRGFLGLTVSCARCHDHKFDPIPQVDYYSLAGVFTSCKLANVPLGDKERIKRVEDCQAKIKKLDSDIKDMLRVEKAKRAEAKAEELPKYLVATWKVQAAKQKNAKTAVADIAKTEMLDPAVLNRCVKLVEKNPAGFEMMRKMTASEQEVQTAALTMQRQVKAMINTKAKLDKMKTDLLNNLFYGDNSVFQLSDAQIRASLPEAAKTQLDAMSKSLTALQKSEDAKPLPIAHGLTETTPTNMKVFLRGNPAKLGDEAPRRFLKILADNPKPFTQGSGRLELAEAIASKDNPLTARVIVNRVWQYHFGRPIVGTPSNFGSLGDRPSHPELLDYLAVKFSSSPRTSEASLRGEGGFAWSLKKLHREIMLSAAYQLSSQRDEKNFSIDGDNRWLWRMNRRRLDIESWRDAMLAASGKLDPKLGGPTTNLAATDNVRRTVYAKISRHDLNFVLRLFDFPDANITSERRVETTVPQQQLYVLNSPFVIDMAKAMAARVQKEATGDTERVQRAFLLAYGRPATSEETELFVQFLAGKDADPTANRLTRWERVAQILIGSNEFMYVD